MANDLPIPKSYEQITSGLLSTYASKLGITDFNTGSAVTSIFETVGLYTARASGDFFSILRDNSVNRAKGEALKRLAQENNVPPLTAKPSTGLVTVLDSSFSKIATKIYAGANPPNIGSTQIPVSDASLFSATGSIYLGRGTNNVEGPLGYSSITQSGSIYLINLSSPTTKFHNVGETVILAQGGNRAIPINSSVVAPAVGASPDTLFLTTASAVILDGEVSVSSVPVTATAPGSIGNVPSGVIKKFSSPPFSGATATNPLAFTTGRDTETDDQLRVRIKLALASTGLGTATAIKAAVIGATPSDEHATVVNDSIQSDTNGATLYIDDGGVYEEKSSGVGLETIVNSALGGEQFFQLSTGGRQAPIAKAFLKSSLSAPFDVKGGDTLAITVGSSFYQHVFSTSDFISPGAATAYEITASVNANTTLGFEASTSGGGAFVVFMAKAETNDSLIVSGITTSGRDVSVLLGLPNSKAQTLRLYKNRVPLNKDGSNATVISQNQTSWSSAMANGDTLILAVDSTASITYTINDSDFIAAGLTHVSSSNSIQSWITVLNSKLVGVTAALSGQQITLTSNLGASSRAKIVIDPSSTLVTKGMFSSALGLSAQGATSDYTLSRNTAQIKLVTPLVAGDQLAAGTTATQASLTSGAISGGNLTLTANGHLWILLDAPGTLIPTGVASNTLLTVSTPASNTIRYTSAVSSAFSNVLVGDYVIVWSGELISANRCEGRVAAVSSTTLDIVVTPTEYAAVVPVSGVVFNDGFVVLRSTLAPQKFKVTSGVNSIDDIAAQLATQTTGIVFGTIQEQYLQMTTLTKSSSGSIMLVTADSNGKLLNFTLGQSSTSKDSLVAFYDTLNYDASMPLFVQALVATGAAADPIDSYVSSFVSATSLSGRDPNELLGFLHPYGVVRDAQPYGEIVQEASISGTTVGLNNQRRVRRVRANDRFFVASPLDFGPADTAVAIVDNDASSKSFSIPFYRRAVANTSTVNSANNFNAYDVDAGSSAAFTSTFASTFDFSNFKALMRAKKTLKPTPTKTALLFRSTLWGRSGEKINVGYGYPSSANSGIGNTVTVGSSVNIVINLKSGTAISTAIDPTTAWNVSITANTPVAGIDQVTYTYASGTTPALTLSGGEYVNIGSGSELSAANTGVFRVSTQGGFAPSSTSFTVQRPTGVAVSESGKHTLVNGTFQFYNSSSTLASDINTYVNANLSSYVSSTIVNDGGSDGSGIIVLSTAEDSAFAFSSVQLKDGINWISSSNIGGSPQFTFKQALALSSDVGYAFNAGEEVRLVPTTMGQVCRLISVLGVTGFTTVGTIQQVNRGRQVELSSETLGGQGALQIIGGAANSYQVPVLDSAIRLDNTYMQASANSIAAQSAQSDQWFRLLAANTQKKSTQFFSNTAFNITPASNQATVAITGRTLTQRNFGKPRHHVRSQAATFRVEKQGSLVCLSWNGSGTYPAFHKVVNFNATSGTLNVSAVTGTNDFQYRILTGAAGFGEVSIGDQVTVAGLPVAANNGTFLVTGVSDDGTVMQVSNSSGVNEFSKGTFTFTGNSTIGDAFTVGTTTLVAGTNFAIGASQTATAANLSAVIGTISGVTSSVSGSTVTITATTVAASIALSYAGSAVVTASGASLAGDAYSSTTFTCTTLVGEGDSMVITSPFNVLNQGTFRVIRRNGGAIWFENANAFEEEVTLPLNAVSLGFDSTTSFKVSSTNRSLYLNWNGSGLEPHLENAKMGDLVTFGADFSSGNQGTFMVLRSGIKLQQVTQLLMPAGNAFATSGVGNYFLLYTAGGAQQYFVWFNTGANSAPTVGGFTAVPVSISSSDTSTAVATKLAAVLSVTTGLACTSSSNVATVTTTGFIETTTATAATMPSGFIINVTQFGRRTFLECINPSAANQSAVTVSGTLQAHRPQIQFFEYDATLPGDSFVITGVALGNNVGTYSILSVIDRDTAVIQGTLVSVTAGSLNGAETSVYVLEASPYFGYKHVYLVAAQPGAINRTYLTFDTNFQYDKINQAAGVEMVSLNKMNYSTVLKQGLDSYSYNTGLIAEANRIIYGDPRDPTTYPGVAAAGAEIFTKAPLTKRIQVALVIRTATGVPFSQAVSQVRSSIQSLINSNPVGQAIAISSIVAVVNQIPGITAVSVSSPLYSTTNDIINLAAREKARILDPISDISVSINGN